MAQVAQRGDGSAGQLVEFTGDEVVEQRLTEYGAGASTIVIASKVMIRCSGSDLL